MANLTFTAANGAYEATISNAADAVNLHLEFEGRHRVEIYQRVPASGKFVEKVFDELRNDGFEANLTSAIYPISWKIRCDVNPSVSNTTD